MSGNREFFTGRGDGAILEAYRLDKVPIKIAAKKKHAHELIERLDALQLSTAVRFLEFISADPIARSIAEAPLEDEPLSDKAKQALRRSEAWFKKNDGKGIPMDEVLAEFGLTMNDFPAGKHGP